MSKEITKEGILKPFLESVLSVKIVSEENALKAMDNFCKIMAPLFFEWAERSDYGRKQLPSGKYLWCDEDDTDITYSTEQLYDKWIEYLKTIKL